MTTLAELRIRLIESFDIEELRTLCFDLGIDYDSLRGEGKAAKVRDLILSITRQNRIDDLLTACKMARPEVDWPDQVSENQFLTARHQWAANGAWKLGLIVIVVLVILGTIIIAIFNQNQNQTAGELSGLSPVIATENAEAIQVPSVTATVTPATLTVTMPPTISAALPSATAELTEAPTVSVTLTPVQLNKLNESFRALLDRDPTVKDIQEFVMSNPGMLEAVPQNREGEISWGTLPFFPIAEGIVPDFTIFVFQAYYGSQLANYVVFTQFLLPTDLPFAAGSDLSPSLQAAINDTAVYIEAVDNNYEDYAQRLLGDDRFFLPTHGLTGYFAPDFRAVIVIGRRESLSKSDINQIQEMNASNPNTTIVTYDTLLDYLNALPGSNTTK